MKLKTVSLSLLLTFTVPGCSSLSSIHIPGVTEPSQVGGADGIQFYEHEEYSAIRQPRRWYGVGPNNVLPEDYPPGSEQRERVRELQIKKLRDMGLDENGRPLNQ